MSGEGEPHEHSRYSRAYRAVTTPTGSDTQHPTAGKEATGLDMANCGRTGPGARCVFGRTPVTAGLYGAEETARRSFPSSTKGTHSRKKARKPAFVELIAPPSAMLRECAEAQTSTLAKLAPPHTAAHKLSHQLLNFRSCTSLGR